MSWRDDDRRLLTGIDAVMQEAREHWGSRWGCGRGRNDCCHGPFPINQLDGLRLREGLARLSVEDPETAADILGRAREHVELDRDHDGVDSTTGFLAADDDRRMAYFDAEERRPCPVLDPESGACRLYDARPFTCRTFGPPTAIADDRLPACPYCFEPIAAAEAEAGRVEPDPRRMEDAILDRLESEGLPVEETVIAHALVPREL